MEVVAAYVNNFFVKQLVIFILLLACWSRPMWSYGQPKSSSFPQNSTHQKQKQQHRYKVIGIKDGDTFVLLKDGKEQVVRFAHIDCPEKKQPFGNKAKQFVSDRCFGKYVTLIHQNRYDRNKRLIAEVVLENGSNLNKELVKNGLAWHFKKFSQDKEYAQLETQARKKKIGIWSEPNPIAPWNWRKGRKAYPHGEGKNKRLQKPSKDR